MTLTNRLTLFFLTALAGVLVAFSLALYLIARFHLTRQLDERAEATLDTLVAAAELEPDGLEWDRRERNLWTKRDEPTVWAVFDTLGREVDGEPDHVRLLRDSAHVADGGQGRRGSASWQGEEWRVYGRPFSHPKADVVDRRAAPGEPRVPGDERYRTLVFVIAAPFEPVGGTLRTLAWSLLGVSVVVWTAAAAVSRVVCRRALAPLAGMSATVRTIRPDELSGRVPVPATRDELTDLAVAFNELLVRLQEAFERQRRFTGEASHQLRTPLTAMLGQMEVALRRDRDPEEYRRVLASAVAQAGRLRQIVEALLFLARADAEAEMTGLETVDLVGWLERQLAEEWKDHPRSRDLRLEHPGFDTVLVSAHPTLLGQAVNNLIDNAFKYSLPGTPVHLQLVCDAGCARMIVRDEGPGIAADETGRVFEPFFRTEEARRSGVAGAGLGLAVTARIVAAFRGTVRLVPIAGLGCAVEIRLPLARPHGPTAVPPTASTPFDLSG